MSRLILKLRDDAAAGDRRRQRPGRGLRAGARARRATSATPRPSAVFRAAFINIGVSNCDMGTSWLLPRLIGASRSHELMLTGRRVAADEAERIGLVAAVVDGERCSAHALEAAEQIAAWSPWGIRLTKQGMWSALEIPSEQAAIEYEDRQQIMATHGAAPPEAIGAFLEKRPAAVRRLTDRKSRGARALEGHETALDPARGRRPGLRPAHRRVGRAARRRGRRRHHAGQRRLDVRLRAPGHQRVNGVHTRLTGRALVLDDGHSVVALLATDLGAPFQKDSLVARVHDLGFTHDSILYSSTHTHSGPGDLDPWQVAQLAKAIRKAYETRVPVRAAWGGAKVTDANQNRSIEAHLANHGIEQFYGEGFPGEDPFGADHARDVALRVLRVDRVSGGPLAAWTNFPVHLTTSTPAVDVWDADLAAAATLHLTEKRRHAGLRRALRQRLARRPDAAL